MAQREETNRNKGRIIIHKIVRNEKVKIKRQIYRIIFVQLVVAEVVIDGVGAYIYICPQVGLNNLERILGRPG